MNCISRFIETAFNLFDVTGDGHINAKVFIVMLVVTMVMATKIMVMLVMTVVMETKIMVMLVMMMMLETKIVVTILFSGVCLCE